MSTARRSAPVQARIRPVDHAGRPLVVDVRSLPELVFQPPAPPEVPVPAPLGELAAAPGRPGPAEPREPTFDELVHGYGRHRGAVAAAARRGMFGIARGARRASGRRG